jgi:hypothetical protein
MVGILIAHAQSVKNNLCGEEVIQDFKYIIHNKL